jgi:hypothetical protein
LATKRTKKTKKTKSVNDHRGVQTHDSDEEHSDTDISRGINPLYNSTIDWNQVSHPTTQRRPGQTTDAEPVWNTSPFHISGSGATQILRPADATQLDPLTDIAFPTKQKIATQTAVQAPPDPVVAAQWRTQFAATRSPMANRGVTDDLDQLTSLMAQWPKFERGPQFMEAKTLKDSLTGSKANADVVLHQDLTNLLAQSERQEIIKESLGNLGGRQALGVTAGAPARLEAVCLWQVVEGDNAKDGTKGANFWHPGWTKVMYVDELASAPWNVGWPTAEPGVAGGGSELVRQMKARALKEGCDGIGLYGLQSNIDFYLKTGFQFRAGNSRENPGGFPPFYLDVRK